MDKPPLVSVLMSVYNERPAWLRAAVESILAQELADWELVVVDDGSADDVTAVLAGYRDPRIRCIRNTANLGLPRSLNIAIAAARGTFFARQDSDDLSAPSRLRKQATFLDAHPEVGIVSSAFIVMNERGRHLCVVRMGETDHMLRPRLERMNCLGHGPSMLRRACIDAVGGYRELATCQDYDLWLRIAERFRIASLPEPLYRWRLNITGVSIQRQALQARYIALVQELAAERKQFGKDSFDPATVHERLTRSGLPERTALWDRPMRRSAELHLLQAARLAAYGAQTSAIRYGLRGLLADPLNPTVWALVVGRPVTKTAKRWLHRTPQ